MVSWVIIIGGGIILKFFWNKNVIGLLNVIEVNWVIFCKMSIL